MYVSIVYTAIIKIVLIYVFTQSLNFCQIRVLA